MKTRAVVIAQLLIVYLCAGMVQSAVSQSTQDRFFDSGGVKIRYQIWGQGPPVVLIHGFGETLERWQRGDVVRVLSPHFQLIAMDVRGNGRSGKPHEQKFYGTELAGDVVRLLRHLSKTKAHIVGYSMGALVALDFAVLHQDSALSVILGGAGWIPPEALNDFNQLAEGYEKGTIPVREGDDARALAALLRGLRVLKEEDVRRITVPIAAVIGANDRFLPHVQRLSQVLPALQIRQIPDANHATAPDHPKFAETLLAVLKQQGQKR